MMRFISNLSTRGKLTAGFSVVVALTVSLGISATVTAVTARKDMQLIGHETIPALTSLLHVTDTLDRQAFAVLELAGDPDEERHDKHVASFQETRQRYRQYMDAYRATDMRGRMEHVERVEELEERMSTLVEEHLIQGGHAAGDRAQVVFVETVFMPLVHEAQAELKTLEDIEVEFTTDMLAKVESHTTRDPYWVLTALLLSLVGSTAIAWFLSTLIANPLRKTVAVLRDVADGRLDVRLEHHSGDEVGQMADALNHALGQMQTAMHDLGCHGDTLAAAAEELSVTSAQIAQNAEDTATQLTSASESAAMVSSTVEMVAAGTEEMGASISEISSNTSSATGVAVSAVSATTRTSESVTRLGASSEEITEVVKVVTAIAEQTNLLALNATIEAARAGEMGKGFAVVAEEVKELASETSKATADIHAKVEAIQADTTEAVGAIDEITGIISGISDAQVTVASAVEEQTVTTKEMARAVSNAADGSVMIAERIATVKDVAQQTHDGATATAQAAAELAATAENVRELINRFKT